MANRKDPYQSYRFRVELDGIQRGGFREVAGLDVTNDAVPYREGNEPARMRQLPGMTKYANITLKGGITDDDSLIKWKQQTVDGKTERKNGSIILCDDAGEEKLRWNFHEAWIVKWSGPSFNASANEVAIESIELAHEGVVKA
ncbi:phage tail protein [Pseudorhodoferax sp.]|uniref:phage tail protein n=1 Tax=Pseudorhodoferax sp. TaxID=1993553 RepID=UPI0039E5D743